MRKLRKVMALLLTLAMVMGMSLTTFAATRESAYIKIQDSDGNPLSLYNVDTNPNGVQLQYAQIIKPAQNKVTGWDFVNDNVAKCFINAFTTEETPDLSAQDVIKKLIDTQKDKDTNIAGTNTTQIANALSGIVNASPSIIDYTLATANPFEVKQAGVYLITAEQEGYTYNTMAAYVGFGEVTIDEIKYDYPSLTDAEITAKRSPETVVKGTDDPDHVVAVDDIVTYTIRAHVPFIDPSDINKKFSIVDTLSGADYYLTGPNAVAKVEYVGTPNNTLISDDASDFVITDNSFEIDLSNLITEDNENAGKEIIVTYTVKVTGETVHNTAASHVGGEKHNSEPVDIYTGTITLKKVDADNEEKTLAGAGFEVRKDDGNEPLTFTELEEGVYVYDEDGAITEVVTGSDGTLVLKGLDVGTYKFKEITAPEGYHIKNDPSGVDGSAKLEVEGGTASEILTGEETVENTKLASLPSTGGIGTTIFTIGGCVIMIAAAGLYFASRRKHGEN